MLLILRSWISSLLTREMTVCHFGHPVCANSLGPPEETDTDWITKEVRPITRSPRSTELVLWLYLQTLPLS